MNMINIIGETNIDFVFSSEKTTSHLNLGGILHACKASKAMNTSFTVYHISPSYLVNHVTIKAKELNCTDIFQMGEITECPNVLTISHPQEAKDQGYNFLLHDFSKTKLFLNANDITPSELNIIFVTSLELAEIAIELSKTQNVAIDIGRLDLFRHIHQYSPKFEIVFVSTSSQITKEFSDEQLLLEKVGAITKTVVYKQNRGGICIYNNETITRIPAYLTDESVHSIGVGDVFNIAFSILKLEESLEKSGKFASGIASKYSQTYDFNNFFDKAKTLFLNKEVHLTLSGTTLPWSFRKSLQIYIAAADFSFRDKKYIDEVCDALNYHNFSVFRPIFENGELQGSDSLNKKRSVFHKDLDAINDSQIIIGIYDDYNDPGTLIELGYAWGQGKRVIVFDPSNKAVNPMLLFGPNMLSSSLDEVINSVFDFGSTLYARI
jgi:nucleoside 2-deoxyribosyltransferase